jgi:hypothetical protein
MSPTRLGYRELGLEVVSLEENSLAIPRGLPWRKKREMRENNIPSRFCSRKLSHNRGMIFWIIFPNPSTIANNSKCVFVKESLWGASLFKVQVNFYIPIFEG